MIYLNEGLVRSLIIVTPVGWSSFYKHHTTASCSWALIAGVVEETIRDNFLGRADVGAVCYFDFYVYNLSLPEKIPEPTYERVWETIWRRQYVYNSYRLMRGPKPAITQEQTGGLLVNLMERGLGQT